jgi:hypothetical protein
VELLQYQLALRQRQVFWLTTLDTQLWLRHLFQWHHHDWLVKWQVFLVAVRVLSMMLLLLAPKLLGQLAQQQDGLGDR